MQDGWKAVWSIPCVSVAFFPSLKQNCITYRSSKVQIGFLKFTNCDNQDLVECIPLPTCYSFEPEIIRIGQSSHKMYSNNIVNFQESTTVLKACTKTSGNLLKAPRSCQWFLFRSIWVCPEISHAKYICRNSHIPSIIGHVVWGYKIHPLYLCKGVRSPSQRTSKSLGECRVLISCHCFPDAVWIGMVVPVWVPSMGQIVLFSHLLYKQLFNCVKIIESITNNYLIKSF